MKKIIQWLTHFAAHLQCTQAKAAKAYIAKELQANASASNRITINFLQNFINRKSINTLSPPTTQYRNSEKNKLKFEKLFVLLSEHPPSCLFKLQRLSK